MRTQCYKSKIHIKKSVLPELQNNQKIELPDHDEAENLIVDDLKKEKDDYDRTLNGRAFYISYTDGKGQFSKRRISVFYVKPNNGNPIIMAWCYERDAYRQFLVKKIIEAADAGTGEYITDIPSYFGSNFSTVDVKNIHEPAQENPKIIYDWEKLFNQFIDEIIILLIVARSDGRLVAKERQVLFDYCVARCPDLLKETERLEKRLKGFYPAPEAFDTSLNKIIKMDNVAKNLFIEHMWKLVNADGNLKTTEQQIAEKVEKLINKTI